MESIRVVASEDNRKRYLKRLGCDGKSKTTQKLRDDGFELVQTVKAVCDFNQSYFDDYAIYFIEEKKTRKHLWVKRDSYIKDLLEYDIYSDSNADRYYTRIDTIREDCSFVSLVKLRAMLQSKEGLLFSLTRWDGKECIIEIYEEISKIESIARESALFTVGCLMLGKIIDVPSAEEIHKMAVRIGVEAELREIAHDLNGGEEIDWSQDNLQCKYFIYRNPHGFLETHSSYYTKYPVIYCLSPAFLDVAIERIGKPILLEYFDVL